MGALIRAGAKMVIFILDILGEKMLYVFKKQNFKSK